MQEDVLRVRDGTLAAPPLPHLWRLQITVGWSTLVCLVGSPTAAAGPRWCLLTPVVEQERCRCSRWLLTLCVSLGEVR